MRVIVAGSRTFQNHEQLSRICHKVFEIKEVVCGEAKGADTLGREWASWNNITVKSFPAEWGVHGKKAGIVRNRAMGDYADALIAFWDGQSRGTEHMINYMLFELHKPVHVEFFE